MTPQKAVFGLSGPQELSGWGSGLALDHLGELLEVLVAVEPCLEGTGQIEDMMCGFR